MSIIGDIADAVHAALDGGTIGHDTGAEHLHTNQVPPYVVWVPGPVVEHEHQGHHIGGVATGTSEVGTQFMTRAYRVAIHVWHEDKDKAEELVLSLLTTLYEQLSFVSFEPRGEVWAKEGEHEFLEHGELAVVAVKIRTPAYRNRLETVDMTTHAVVTTELVEEIT